MEGVPTDVKGDGAPDGVEPGDGAVAAGVCVDRLSLLRNLGESCKSGEVLTEIRAISTDFLCFEDSFPNPIHICFSEAVMSPTYAIKRRQRTLRGLMISIVVSGGGGRISLGNVYPNLRE